MSFKENKWNICFIGDVADILNGYAFKAKDFQCKGVPIIKIKNIVPPNISIEDVQYVSRDLYNEKIKYALKYNDILISMTGSGINQISSAVGKIGRVRIKDESLLLNQRVGKLFVKDKNKCDEDYLYYYMTQNSIRYDLASSAGGSANQANISPAQIKSIKIILPPLEEQKAIAKILSDLDEKIEVNNKINKNLEEMAQAIFKQWFVDFEFPNEEGKPYKSSGGEMVESELGMIPKGWSINKISEISEIKNGVNYSRNQEGELVKVINVRDFNGSLIVNDNSLDNIYLQQKQIDDYKLKKFDTVIVRSAKPGETILVDNDEIKVYSGFTIRVRTKKQSNKLYIFYCLRNSMKKIENSSNGTIFKNLNQRILGALNFAMPSEKILLKYNNLSEIIIEQISMKTKENERLEKLRDTLLPKLMSGEIRVPLENSEN
ncbi:restriction endonuclease subunit S [Clostridium perfringens]|uniref:restriction endonuclease subunit S n=1 Tax=Clostridium perfringens TaxID=1502 RepID=UPI001A1FC4A4|nr:restriction endonuclease subunit S [Clostridium perfringens]MDK0821299.1 restriction endonuclease subunit S [Clostridium perfringens]MDM0616822.1 restriction endonuclease subunit S [Clostridium perfringens]MDM0925521.1 restriction endonuclease subunit S [Clostridium perfringens]MDM0947786.1 restriction endonuclease subunit S [Clostridium perfringens]HAT4211974.1 restriction endonuclease subunit S [Clostridium perfringens]